MSNIFQTTAIEPRATPYTGTAVADTTVAQTVSAIGNTLWEGYKGKQVADFVQGEDTTDIQVEGVDESKTISRLDSSTGLRKLEAAVLQGRMNPQQAQVIATARAKRYINSMPGIASDIRRELNLFNMGIGSIGEGRQGASDISKYDPAVAAAKADFEAMVDLRKTAITHGVSEAQVIKWNQQDQLNKQQTTALELETKQTAAYARYASDMAASIALDADHNLQAQLFSITGAVERGEMNDVEAQQQWSATVAAHRQRIRSGITTWAKDAPINQRAEIISSMDAELARFDKYYEDLNTLSVVEQRKTIMEAMAVADAAKISTQPVGRLLAGAKAAGLAEAIPAIQNALADNRPDTLKLILDLYGLDASSVQGLNDNLTESLHRLISGEDVNVRDPAQRDWDSSKQLVILDKEQGNKPTKTGWSAVAIPSVTLNVLKNATMADSNNLLEALAERPAHYITNVLTPEHHEQAMLYLDREFAKAIYDYNYAIEERSRTTTEARAVGQFAFSTQSILPEHKTLNYSRDRIAQIASIIKKNPGLVGNNFDSWLNAFQERSNANLADIIGPERTEQMQNPELIDVMYDSIAAAEGNRFIRTQKPETPSGSTAYGPVQITMTLAKDMLRRHKDKFSDDQRAYLDRFIEQGKLFSKYGNEPAKEGYDKRYDYGGEGALTGERDKLLYESTAKTIMSILLREEGNDIKKFIERWRGKVPEKAYQRRLENNLKRNDAPAARDIRTSLAL